MIIDPDSDSQSKFKYLFRFTHNQVNVELYSLMLQTLSFSCFRKWKCTEVHQERPLNKVVVCTDICVAFLRHWTLSSAIWSHSHFFRFWKRDSLFNNQFSKVWWITNNYFRSDAYYVSITNTMSGFSLRIRTCLYV